MLVVVMFVGLHMVHAKADLSKFGKKRDTTPPILKSGPTIR
jgi:hypothetical protein